MGDALRDVACKPAAHWPSRFRTQVCNEVVLSSGCGVAKWLNLLVEVFNEECRLYLEASSASDMAEHSEPMKATMAP